MEPSSDIDVGRDMGRMLEEESLYPNFLDFATREMDPKFREDLLLAYRIADSNPVGPARWSLKPKDRCPAQPDIIDKYQLIVYNSINDLKK